MQVDYLVLADAAVTAEGKHYIHGAGWDVIFAATFPVQHPLLAVALRLGVPWTATNQPHRLEVDVVDADGRSVMPSPPGVLTGEVNVGRPPHIAPGDDQHVPLTLSLRNLEFSAPGSYSIVVRIDGSDEARSTFRLQQLG